MQFIRRLLRDFTKTQKCPPVERLVEPLEKSEDQQKHYFFLHQTRNVCSKFQNDLSCNY